MGDGTRLDAASVRRLACGANVLPAGLGSHSEPPDIGRQTRTAPAALRRALVVRDEGCAFPDRERPPPHCDAHHVEHWSSGGDTSPANLVLLCRRHHRLLHHTDWTVRVGHGRPRFDPPAFLLPWAA